MATEGTFSGNTDSTSIDQIMVNGFTSMVNAIAEQSKTVTKINTDISAYIKDSETRHKDNIKATKSISSRLTKEYNLIQKETNPLLTGIINSVKALYDVRSNPISKTSSDGSNTVQVIKWEDSQFADLMDTLAYGNENANPSPESINSMQSLFSTVIGGINSMRNTEGSGFLSSLFAPSFQSQAKKFTKAYETVINGIVSSLVKLNKQAGQVENAGEILVTFLKNIDEFTKNMVAGQKLKALAGSIAFLGLALVAFAAISPTVLVVVGALTLLKGLTFAMATTTTKDILRISAAIALFGLAIWAFGEIVTGEALIKTAAGILILGLAIKGFSMAIGNGMGPNGIKTLLLTTITIAALGIALQTYNDVQWEDMGKAAAALIGMAGAMWVISKVPDAAVGAASLVLGALALGAIGLALRVFPSDSDMLLPIGLFVLGFGTTLALAGAAAPLIAAGAAVMVVGGIALLAIAAGLAVITATPFSKDKIVEFTETLKFLFLNIGTGQMLTAGTIAAVAIAPMFIATTMATGMALGLSLISSLPYNPEGAVRLGETAIAFFSVMGSPEMIVRATLATVAAVPMLAAATMGSVIGLELALISNLTYDSARIGEFGTSMTLLAQSYISTAEEIGFIGAAKFLAGIGIATTMAVATPLVAFALVSSSIASKLISNESIAKFSNGVSGLIGAYSNVSGSIGGAPKLLANVALIGDIANSTINIGKGIAEFVKISDKPEAINAAVNGVGDFVSRMISVLSEKGEQLKNIPAEAKNVLGIGNLMKDVAEGIKAMGNMEYYETALVDGKIVKVGKAIKFTPADFKRVGDSLGVMLTSISAPLAAIGDEGGWFSSNKTKKGIEALSQIGSVFNPIVSIITAFRGGKTPIMAEDTKDITNSIMTLLLGVSATFKRMDNDGTLEYFSGKSDMLLGLRDTLKYLSGMTGDGMSKVSQEVNKIFDTIGNEKPMTNLTKNLTNIRKEATLIRAEVNKFDLQRLTLFNQTTKNLLDAAKNGTMEQLIRAMSDLVNELRISKTVVAQAPVQQNTPFSFGTQQAPNTLTPTVGGVPQKTADIKTANEILEDKLNTMIETMTNGLKTLNGKIQNPMPVKIIDNKF